MANPSVDRDPFNVPRSLIPNGTSYQWISHTIFGRPDPAYNSMIEKGWRPVPWERHGAFFGSAHKTKDGHILIGGCILMERSEELTGEAMDLMEDQAALNAGHTHRQVEIPIKIVMDIFVSPQRSSRVEAIKTIDSMLNGAAPGIVIAADDGVLQFRREVHCRYDWLQWLFNLISTK